MLIYFSKQLKVVFALMSVVCGDPHLGLAELYRLIMQVSTQPQLSSLATSSHGVFSGTFAVMRSNPLFLLSVEEQSCHRSHHNLQS